MDSDFLLPFLTTFRENSDYNSNDEINEINSLILRNETIENYLLGEQTEDYLFDLLAQEGIDPHFYAKAVEDEIIYLMTNPDKLYA